MRNTRNYLDVHSVVDGPIVPPTPPTPPDPVTYNVLLPTGEGYTTAFVAGSSSPVEAGSDVNFTVVATEGYDIVSVSAGGNTLTDVNGVYTIYGIAANIAVVVLAHLIPTPVTYTVALPEAKNHEFTADFVAGSSSPALAGSTVNFTVVAYEGYEITSVTDGNGNVLTPVNGVYTIDAIAADTKIFVEVTPVTPPTPVTYTVTLPTDPNYTAAFVAGSESPALAGSVVNFTVVADDGLEITSVTDGTNTLTGVNDVYTINGIVADTTVVVVATPIIPVTYTVSLPKGTGYTAAFVAGSSSPALALSTVNFTVVADEGYEITSVTDGHSSVPEANGVYTIYTIAANTSISVEVTPVTPPVTYAVVLPTDTSYTAAFVAGSSSPAVAGSVVNFTVVATDGYVITEVSDGTNTLTGVNDVYTINGIAANTIISVGATLIGG